METNLVFKLTVTDFGGLQGTDNCSILVLPPAAQPDTVPPEIQVTEPGRDFIFTTSTRATVRGTAWDDRQVDRIEWSSNQGYSGVAQGTGNWEIVDLQLSPWMNQITLTAYDTAGNSRSVQLKIYAIIWP